MINLAFIDPNKDVLNMMALYCNGIPDIQCVYTADNTQQAFDYLVDNPYTVNLLCCTVSMPKMVGFEIVHHMNREYRHLAPDFAIITAHASLTEINFSYPIAGILHKPVFFKEFTPFVNKYVSQLSVQQNERS